MDQQKTMSKYSHMHNLLKLQTTTILIAWLAKVDSGMSTKDS